jgi:hypothetical protein
MQKIKEFLDKDRDFKEILPDLSKNFMKTVEKTSEILKDFLDHDPNRPKTLESGRIFEMTAKIQEIRLEVLKNQFSGDHSFDLSSFESLTREIIEKTWSALHFLPSEVFSQVKEKIIECQLKTFQELLKLFGLSALHPKVFRISKNFLNFFGKKKESGGLLRSLAKSIGSSSGDLIHEYLENFEIISSILKDLQVLTCQENVTLGLCKKNSKKKIGNGHQRRHHKVVMKKTENKILKSMTLDEDSKVDLNFLEGNLKLLILYLQQSPCKVVDLDLLFSFNIARLAEGLRFLVVEVMFNYVVLYKKHFKKIRNVLNEFSRDLDFRSTCRRYFFILENLVNVT